MTSSETLQVLHHAASAWRVGQERTQAEYETLFRNAGLRPLRTSATASPLSLIEGGHRDALWQVVGAAPLRRGQLAPHDHSLQSTYRKPWPAVNQMIFVFPHRHGGWAVQREGTNRVGRRAPTFEAALQMARQQADRDGAQVEVRSTHPRNRDERRIRV